jgi:hypothetical protein
MTDCIICSEKDAKLKMKNTQNYYCNSCAKELFADISYLEKVEKEAKLLKKKISEKLKK